ncbi:MAG TPA: DinB family protein, partial [Tianweitania sediminis]|nr:DinB family protein [Tianweitania sediminis]
MRQVFEMFAAYNAWANHELYEAAAQLTDEEFGRDTGAFFKSMRGTLNHILVADRIWMKRFTGRGEVPTSLAAIIHPNLA